MQEQGQEDPSEASSSTHHHLTQNTGKATEAGGDDDNKTLVPSTHAESERKEQEMRGLGQPDRTDEWHMVGEVVRTYDDGRSNIRELIRVRWEAVE